MYVITAHSVNNAKLGAIRKSRFVRRVCVCMCARQSQINLRTAFVQLKRKMQRNEYTKYNIGSAQAHYVHACVFVRVDWVQCC